MRTRVLLAALLATLAGCTSDPATSPTAAAKPDLAPKAAEVNARIPAGLTDKLEFEVRELDEGNVLALVPKGWAPGMIPGSLRPPNDELGERVSYEIGSNCDGACTKKDWAAVVEDIEFTKSVPPGLTRERDEAIGETGRLRVFSGGDQVFVRTAWWQAESRRYFHCRADLRASASMAKDAFVAACLATHVLDWD